MSDAANPASPTLADLVSAADAGDRHPAGELLSSLYGELRGLAARQLRLGAPGSTLGATTLLHAQRERGAARRFGPHGAARVQKVRLYLHDALKSE